jgi:hypothetical protein
MKKHIVVALAAVSLASPALAKGCLKGAAVGGVAGHFVGKGHAVAGAAVGCFVGHHRATVAAKRRAAQAAPPKH